MTKKLAARNAKDMCKCGQVRTLMRSDRRLGVRLMTEEGYGRLFGENDSKSDKRTLHYYHDTEQDTFATSWIRNPL
jgi:hypothetical protein